MSRPRYEYAVLIVLLLIAVALMLGLTQAPDETKRVCVSSATYSPSEGEWQSGIVCNR